MHHKVDNGPKFESLNSSEWGRGGSGQRASTVVRVKPSRHPTSRPGSPQKSRSERVKSPLLQAAASRIKPVSEISCRKRVGGRGLEPAAAQGKGRSLPAGRKVSDADDRIIPIIGMERAMSEHYCAALTDKLDTFLLQLDELFMDLRNDSKSVEASDAAERNLLACYRSICERLRLEVLIARDKLEFSKQKEAVSTPARHELFQNLNSLKSQLFDMRKKYHNTIRKFNDMCESNTKS